MAESKVVLLKDWVDSLNKELSPDDAAKVIYAIVNYSLYGTKLDMKSLNALAESYYTQIDKILKRYPNGVGGRREKYDSEKIKVLASQGMNLQDICKELGIEFSRGIYSNRGYKEGREIYLKAKSQDPPLPADYKF